MSRKNDLVQAWMPKQFHKKVKLEAVKNEKSMAEYMRDLASSEDPLNDLFGKDGKGKGGGGIPFGF